VKVGVTGAVTTMSIVVVEAPWPAFGVNVYFIVPTVAVLIVAGFHVPEKLLVDVSGRDGAVALRHKGPICVKVGVAALVICTVIVAVVAH
jgi:hypothetical protein